MESTASSTTVKPAAGSAITDSAQATDSSVRASDRANVNINRFEFSDRTLSIVALFASALTLGFVIGLHFETRSARFMAERAEVQSEATRQQVMNHDALLVQMGVFKPSDINDGPGGPQTRRK